jgi:hypothetical protein
MAEGRSNLRELKKGVDSTIRASPGLVDIEPEQAVRRGKRYTVTT